MGVAGSEAKVQVMHTYLKYEDGTYTVGQWLVDSMRRTSFHKLFDVPDQNAAIAAVNTLNGGHRDSGFAITKEH